MKKYIVLIVLLVSACTPATDPVSPVTVDPFVAVEQAQRTAEAAQQEAQFYGSQLTATAQAPLVAMTATAGAWEMQQAFALATAQAVRATETAAMTQTAILWTPTPNATMTAVFLQGSVEATQQAQALKMEELKVQRAATTNTVRAMSLYIFGFVLIVVLIIFSFTFARRLSVIPAVSNEQGKVMPMLDVINGVIVDADRLANGTGAFNTAFLKSLPAVTPERQDAVTQRAQLVDLQTRTKRLPARLLEEQGRSTEAPKQLPAGDDAFFPRPEWGVLESWEPKGSSLPYGVTARGLGLVDMDQFAHFATIGTTGVGKSRRFFRPFIAAALAAGHRVVIVGKSTDYQVFDAHPNARLIHINHMTKQEDAGMYAAVLRSFVEEMNRRDDVLTAQRKSTWTHAGNGRTFIVLDELGNAMRLMPSGAAEQTRIWVEGLVSEGRKTGFNLMVANQRATGMAGILSQTGKAIFRVERDEERAHKSLVGASNLRDGYFLMKAMEVNLTGAFEPNDEELASFLRSRLVPPLDPEPWLEGILIQGELSEPTPTKSLEDRRGELSDEDTQKVLGCLEEGLGASAIVQKVWGVTGGDRWRRLKEKVVTLAIQQHEQLEGA